MTTHVAHSRAWRPAALALLAAFSLASSGCCGWHRHEDHERDERREIEHEEHHEHHQGEHHDEHHDEQR